MSEHLMKVIEYVGGVVVMDAVHGIPLKSPVPPLDFIAHDLGIVTHVLPAAFPFLVHAVTAYSLLAAFLPCCLKEVFECPVLTADEA